MVDKEGPMRLWIGLCAALLLGLAACAGSANQPVTQDNETMQQHMGEW
jgi:Flp pilus assembly protein TadD